MAQLQRPPPGAAILHPKMDENLSGLTDLLYEVVEVNNLGAVPVQVGAETLKLVNPGLNLDHASAIMEECDSRGLQLLTKDDFRRAIAITLQSTPSEDSSRALKDLIYRMRRAFRHRYLMYDAEMNCPPPNLLENKRAVEMFRELFDCESHGKEEISRESLARIAHTVLPDSKVDALSVRKAALGDVVTDLIHFNEFMIVLQPATTRRCLSDMLKLMRQAVTQQKQEASMFLPPTKAWINNQSASAGGGGAERSLHMPHQVTGGYGSRKAPSSISSISVQSMTSELEKLKYNEEIAQRRADNILGAPSVFFSGHALPSSSEHTPPSMQKSTTTTAGANSAGGFFGVDASQGEVAQLKIENDKLKRDVLKLQMQLGGKGVKDSTMPLSEWDEEQMQGTSAAQQLEISRLEQERDRWMHRSQLIENELRMCRAHLHTAQEGSELLRALKQSTNVHSTVRDYYPDETSLVSKHEYVRETGRVLDDGQQPSAISTIFTQYDLLVVAYQSLYRELRKKYETSRPKRFDPVKAAANIVGVSPTPQPYPFIKGGGSKSPTPRVMQATSSPIRWSELDAAPTPEMKNTGMLSDPLLTDNERHLLRAKLAAQMRNSARHYSPKHQARASSTPSRRDQNETVLTSVDAMQRLHHLADRAGRTGRVVEKSSPRGVSQASSMSYQQAHRY